MQNTSGIVIGFLLIGVLSSFTSAGLISHVLHRGDNDHTIAKQTVSDVHNILSATGTAVHNGVDNIKNLLSKKRRKIEESIKMDGNSTISQLKSGIMGALNSTHGVTDQVASTVLDALDFKVNKTSELLGRAKSLVSTEAPAVKDLVEKVLIKGLIGTVKTVLDAKINLELEVASKLAQALNKEVKTGVELVQNLGKTLNETTQNVEKLAGSLKDTLNGTFDTTQELVGSLTNALKGKTDLSLELTQGVLGAVEKAVDSTVQGLKNNVDSVIDNKVGGVRKLGNALKNVLA